jgi:hypothetical protein
MPEVATQPEEQSEELASSDPLAGNKEAQNSLKELVKYFSGLEKYERRSEVIDARRQRFYWRDVQYIYCNPQTFMFAPIAGGASVQTNAGSGDTPNYTDVYNIYTPYGETIVSTLTQNPPGLNFEPDDPSKPEDISASTTAEKFRHEIDRVNERKKLQAEIARLFWTDSRVVLHTRHVKDGQKYGYDPETGEEIGVELITAHGVLESKVPITAKNQSEMLYCILSDDMDFRQARWEYKAIVEETGGDIKAIKEGASSADESAYERFARLGVLQGTRLLMQAGDAFSHLTTRRRTWLRPATFDKLPDEFQEMFRESYPDGCFATFVGDVYCGSENCSMDDQLTMSHPLPGDGQSRSSLGKRMVPLQDAFNDYKNLEHEIFDYCQPWTAVAGRPVDIDAVREQISQPGNIFALEILPGLESMDAMFHEGPNPEAPPSLIQAYQQLQGALSQFCTGALPALQGAADEHNETKGGIAMLRAQALGRMGLPWGAMQELFASAYRQAVMAAAENRPENQKINIKIKGKRGSTTHEISIGDLKKGSFHCVPDTDSTFPETYADKRNTLMMMMQAAEGNPMIAETMAQPDNQELARELGGLPELVIPGAIARNQQRSEIEKLLAEPPIPPSPEEIQAAMQQIVMAGAMAKAAGQMAPPPDPQKIEESLLKPSVPIDPEFDFHKYHFEEIQDWLASDERKEQEKAGNFAGIQNVRLHGLEHKKIMEQQAAAAMPQMPPPKAKPAAMPPHHAQAEAPAQQQVM